MIRIGVVGTGNMANAYHARILDTIADVEIACCCDSDEDSLTFFSKKWGVKKTYGDYKQMIDAEKLDGICNVTPDVMHKEISIYALENGVSVLCEKPMAVTLEDAQQMARAAHASDAIHMVNYSKRDYPGLRGAKSFIDSGKAGTIMHVECSYLQGWLSDMDFAIAEPSKLWRLSTAHGSNGDLGDLGCHIYDMVAFLCGDIDTISCNLKTYQKPVEDNRVGEYIFDANDGFVSCVTFASGAIGTVQSTRWATGYKNREFIRIYGNSCTVEFDADLSIKSYRVKAASDDKWTDIAVDETPNNVQRFIESIKSGINDPNNFENGLKIQAYLDASERSDISGACERVIYSL